MKRVLPWLIFSFVTLVLASETRAQEPYDTVKNAGMFTVGGVGYAGTRTTSELAFRELIKGAKPVASCKRLLEEGTSAGQMYGLLGLHLLDQDSFRAALLRYKDAKESVSIASGCIVFAQTEAAIASGIESGRYK